MWDSALTDFKIINTSYGKDILGPFIKAFRKRGLRIGLYHTEIDHHHPHLHDASEVRIHRAGDKIKARAGGSSTIK